MLCDMYFFILMYFRFAKLHRLVITFGVISCEACKVWHVKIRFLKSYHIKYTYYTYEVFTYPNFETFQSFSSIPDEVLWLEMFTNA